MRRARPAAPEPQLSARLIRPFLRLLRERGAPLEQWEPMGAALDDPDTRLPHRLAIELLELAARYTGDEALGLHAAEHVKPGDFDVLEYAAVSSANIGDAIATSNRYLRLMHDAAEFSLDREGDVAVWRYRLPASLPLPPLAAEYFMAVYVILGRRYSGREPMREGAIHFTHARPRDVTEHERILQGNLRFDQPQNALVIPAWALDMPMEKSDPALKKLLERIASDMLERLPKTDTLVSHARSLLAAQLRGGDPGIEHLASELHTTARTLRRRLQEAGTSHREILEELRKELALRYLGERSLGTEEIAFLLGYSTSSAFHKAFRRWTRTSTAEYRRRASAR